jgi:hypothetical protein
MRINQLRGYVADRPIDSRVVQDDSYVRPAMQRILAVQPQVEQVDVRSLPNYDKG